MLRSLFVASVVLWVLVAFSGCAELIEAHDACDARWRGWDHQAACERRVLELHRRAVGHVQR